MKEFVFLPSKKKFIFNFLIFVTFFGIGCCMLAYEPLFSTKWFIALAGTVFFGIGAMALIIIKRKPFLILNDEGVIMPGYPLVLWSNIRNFEFKDVKIGSGTKTKFLCFFLYDSSVLINNEKRTFASKLASSFNERLLGTPIFVHLGNLSITQEELTDLILDFKKNFETNRTH